MDKRDAGFFGAGLLTGAALYKIFVQSGRRDEGRIRADDDDQVVVTGGSLTIASKYGFESGTDSKTAVHIHKTRDLREVEVQYTNQSGTFTADMTVSGRVQIDIVYTDLSNPGTPPDTVSFTTNGQGQNLSVTSQGGQFGNIKPAEKPKKTLQHGKCWKVQKITVSGTQTLKAGVLGPYYCDSDGQCILTLHYHCSNGPDRCP